MDCSLLGSSVHEIFQARILECVVKAMILPQPRHQRGGEMEDQRAFSELSARCSWEEEVM